MSVGEGVKSSNQARHASVVEQKTVGFFTDATLCIGCKACEVACKEWNQLPEDGLSLTGFSYDNTGRLGAATWRHVKFVESFDQNTPGWSFLSDVCKHCENAGCLEACPTGAIVRTEVGSVFVQDDICNGCGYCVVTCPFGVIERSPRMVSGGGGAHKCSFCYDRQKDGLTPACAKACPTESIAFGPLDELRQRAAARVTDLRARGQTDAALYDASNTSVGGTHAISLVIGDPSRFGLPPNPEVPTARLFGAWLSALVTIIGALALALAAFAAGQP
jgi:formate dehydrogenase iron-sulfur subunit